MKKLGLLLLSFCSVQFLCGQNAPGIEWEKSLGGSNCDYGFTARQCDDHGYVTAGFSLSNDSNVSGNHGLDDTWIVRLDSIGNIEWQRSLGGSLHDGSLIGIANIGVDVHQTLDKGFIIASNSNSTDGDVMGNHGNTDYWIIKLDSLGNIEWQKCLGGSQIDVSYSIQQTLDGGYIVAGFTASGDGDVLGNTQYDEDFWIVKLDFSGNIEWQKCLGGSSWEEAYSIQQTSDSGFIVSGITDSNDGDVAGKHGSQDYWIIRLNSTGNIEWQKCLGGSSWEEAYSIQQTSDSGFIVSGITHSNDGDVTGNHGFIDYWVVKLDSLGNILWQKCLGGSSTDECRFNTVQQTFDAGFVISGYTGSNNGDVSGGHGDLDYWVVKLDSSGNIQWQKCLGGFSIDQGYSIEETADSGYIVIGISSSSDGDVTGNHGCGDYWIVKLAPDIPTSIKNPISDFSYSISPNPSSGILQITFPAFLQRHAILSITNLLGQKLFEEEIPANIAQQTFDFSQWQKGMYFITLRDENSFGQKQLVIQ